MTDRRDNLTAVKSPSGGVSARRRYDYTGGAGAPAAVPAEKTPAGVPARTVEAGSPGPAIAGVLVLAGAFLTLFRINISELMYVWSKDLSWSHGFAVPFLALLLVYLQCNEGRSAMTASKRLAGGLAGLGLIQLVASIADVGGASLSPVLRGTGLLTLLGAGLVVVTEEMVGWSRRHGLAPRPAVAVGLPILVFGVGAHVLFRVMGLQHMTNLSMLTVLDGAVLLVLGWDYMKLLWLPIGFLIFMINPPTTLYVRLTTPMQSIAAQAGVMLLPLLGISAERSGTVINIWMPQGGVEGLNVAEACSGVRMLLAFVALAVALAYTSRRPMWQKLFLACCAGPVAIACNALRVALTGVMYVRMGQAWGKGTPHEYLGFLMLVPALGMQLGIAWILDHIFIEDDGVPAAAVVGEGGR